MPIYFFLSLSHDMPIHDSIKYFLVGKILSHQHWCFFSFYFMRDFRFYFSLISKLLNPKVISCSYLSDSGAMIVFSHFYDMIWNGILRLWYAICMLYYALWLYSTQRFVMGFEVTFLLSIIFHFKSVIYSLIFCTLQQFLTVKLLFFLMTESFELTFFREKKFHAVKLSEMFIQLYKSKCFKLTLYAENTINRKLFLDFTVSKFN